MSEQLTHLIAEYVWMVLEDGDDELDCLHSHIKFLVQRHRHDPILELGREQLQLVLKFNNRNLYYDFQYLYTTVQ
jgi:hypothetical protein